LVDFPGAEATQLVVKALDDDDGHVQAEAVAQLRDRGIPGALGKLIKLLDSPHEAVREKARQSLSEFAFARFLGAFDLLDEEVQQSTGELVRKTDRGAMKALAEEMEAPHCERRRRALAVAVAMDAVEELQANVIRLLEDRDQFVRAEAAKALGHGTSPAVWGSLRRALLDRSPQVRLAAERSLQRVAPQMISAPPPSIDETPDAFVPAPSVAGQDHPWRPQEGEEVP
jgi:HEAT repeat protein